MAVLSIIRIEPKTSPELYFRKLVIDRFRDIHSLLYMRCKYDTSSASAGTFAGAPTTTTGNYLAPSDVKANFYADFGGAHQLLTRVSTTGFRPAPKMMEALYGMFLDERADDTGALDCGQLRTENGGASDIFTMLSEQNASNRGRYLTTNSKQRVSAAFFLAEHVAYGQFLGTLAQAEKYVKDSTSGSYGSVIKNHLLELIYGAASTREIDVAMDRNNQELRGLALEIGDRYRVRNAEVSGAVSASFGDFGKNTAPTSNTDGQ